METLRMILAGQIGTLAQRNTLKRIISQNAPNAGRKNKRASLLVALSLVDGVNANTSITQQVSLDHSWACGEPWLRLSERAAERLFDDPHDQRTEEPTETY